MSFTFDSYQSLLLPIVAIGAYIGWRRGFWGEIGYTLGMALTLMATVIFPEQFLGLISRLILGVPRVFSILFNLNFSLPAADQLFGTPGTGRFLLTQIVLFALLVFLTYSMRYAWAYDGGKIRLPKNPAGKLLGAVFGGITGFFWFLGINSFLNIVRQLRGNDTIPPEGTTISLPTVPNVESLLSFVPTILLITIIVLMVLAVLRLPNIWKG